MASTSETDELFATANTPRFSMAEVEDGRSIHYLAEGPADAPLVLYDAGAFGIYADGWWVKEALKSDFRVCLFDRAGLGASDPVPDGERPTPAFHVHDMRRLVRHIAGDVPVILVGHSMAGLRVHAYANLYPEHLRGAVLVDALSPRVQAEGFQQFAFSQFGNMLKVGAFGAKLGLAKAFAQFAPNNFELSPDLHKDKVDGYASAYHHEGSKNEVLNIDIDADYLRYESIYNFPLAIFASTGINGMLEADAIRAKANTGYGWYGDYPNDDHVSILTGSRALAIGDRVREIHAALEGSAPSTAQTASAE